MIAYLVKLVLCSGLLLLAYVLFLENEKLHRYNRFYLLTGVLLSFLLPLIHVETTGENLPFTQTIHPVPAQETIVGLTHSGPLDVIAPSTSSTGPSPTLLAYLFVTGLLLVRFASNLFFLFQKTRRTRFAVHGKAKLILTKAEEPPHSFLHCIFLNESDATKEEVLHHELAHVTQRHSLDILFMEIVLALAWFNPFFYLYRKAIRLNHEFLADESVLQRFDRKEYQFLLLNTITQGNASAFASAFNYAITKKRILMMSKTTSRSQSTARILATLVLTGITAFVFSEKTNAQQPVQTTAKAADAQECIRDTFHYPPIVGVSIGSTKEGVSDDLLKEYQRIVDNYTKAGAGPGSPLWKMPDEDRLRLETIFKQMSPEQQSRQAVVFIKPSKPLPKIKPTKEQFEAYKNSAVYGVWIDDKKVTNETLNNYSYTDFSQVFISKLYGAAKKGKPYTHQLDLMTNAYYQSYVERASKEARPAMHYRDLNKIRRMKS